MGTHSLIIMRVKSKDGTYQIWTILYQHWDGDFEGVGRTLVKFLTGMTFSDWNISEEGRKVANGAGCLFAQIIALFKKGPRGAYIIPPVDTDERYKYYVDVIDGNPWEGVKSQIELTLKGIDDDDDDDKDGNKMGTFKGSPEEADNYLNNLLGVPPPRNTIILNDPNTDNIKVKINMSGIDLSKFQ